MRAVRTKTDCTNGSVKTVRYCASPGSGRVKLHLITPRNGMPYATARSRRSGARRSAAPRLWERASIGGSGGNDFGEFVERRPVMLCVPFHVKRYLLAHIRRIDR